MSETEKVLEEKRVVEVSNVQEEAATKLIQLKNELQAQHQQQIDNKDRAHQSAMAQLKENLDVNSFPLPLTFLKSILNEIT